MTQQTYQISILKDGDSISIDYGNGRTSTFYSRDDLLEYLQENKQINNTQLTGNGSTTPWGPA